MGSTIEGRLTQSMVQGFCMDSLRTDGFSHRIDECLTRGAQLGIMSEGVEHESIFCQCWLAGFDMLALESWCYLGMWGIFVWRFCSLVYRRRANSQQHVRSAVAGCVLVYERRHYGSCVQIALFLQRCSPRRF